MATIIIGSLAFSVGGAFMGISDGFTKFWPSVIIAACFVTGAGFLAKAVNRGGLSTTYVVGLGIEALNFGGNRPRPVRRTADGFAERRSRDHPPRAGHPQTRLAWSHNRGKGCAVTETASVLTALRGTTYLGSHPRATRRVQDVDIEFTEAGLSMRRGVDNSAGSRGTRLPVYRRRPGTPRSGGSSGPRVLGWPFAWLTISRTTYSYLTVTDSEGDWAFAVPGLTRANYRQASMLFQATFRHAFSLERIRP